MKTKLLLKQSFKDFKSKWIIYFTFTAFLILTLSVIVGLLSFSISFNSEINLVNTKETPNALTSTFNYKFVEEETSIDEEFITIKYNSDFEKFTQKVIENTPTINQSNFSIQEQTKTLLEITGFFHGTLTFIDDSTRNCNTIIQNFTDNQIEDYNNLIEDIWYTKYDFLDANIPFVILSNNILISYFIDKFSNDFDVYSFNALDNSRNLTSDKFITWLSPERWMPTYEQESKIMAQSKIMNTSYFETLDLTNLTQNQKTYFDDSKYVFVTQKTMKQNGYHLGEVIKFYNKNILEERLLLGTATNNYTLNQPNDSNFYFLPFSEIKDRYLFNNELYLDFKNVKGEVAGQEKLNTKFSDDFISTQDIFSKIKLSEFPTAYIVRTGQLYQILVITIGTTLLLLLFFVFYFITQQIIFSQRKTLFFLKAMGVSNAKISLLTTLAIMSPMIISFVVSFIFGLFMQKMMFQAVGSAFCYTPNYLSINWYYWLILLGLSLVMMVTFFWINLKVIKSRLLTVQGIHAFKTPGHISIAFQKVCLKDVSNRIRIGFSFTIRNFYKNLVTLVLLSLSFGIIIFIFQFLQSVNYSLTSYKQWNEPYKSVYANKNLNPIRFEDGGWKQNYNQINANDIEDTDLIPLEKNMFEDIFHNLNPDIGFINEINKYYVPDNTLAWLSSNDGETFINDEVLPILSPDQQDNIQDLYQNLVEQYSLVKSELGLDQKINVLFGQMLKPTNFRSEYTFEIKTSLSQNYSSAIAVTKDDYEGIKKYKLNENEIRTHKNNLELDISISEGFAAWYELKKNEDLEITLPDYRDSLGNQLRVLCNIKTIVEANPISKEIYTTQEDLFNYLAITNKDNINYHQLANTINNHTLSLNNSVYCENNVPIGLTNLTLPCQNGDGTSLFNYQINNNYMNNIQDSIFSFGIINEQFANKSAPFVDIMTNLILLTFFTLLSVSLILIALILLDNREIILLMKSIGYRNYEISGYLTFGYILATIIATIIGNIFAYICIGFCSSLFYLNLGCGISFLFNYKLILFTITLGVSFIFGILYSAKYYIKKRKPKDAFEVL